MADNAVATQTVSDPSSVKNFASGKVVFDATAITAADSLRVSCGFKPKKVRWWNATDRITVEWYEGMAANTSLKTAAAGTQTLEVANGGITVDDRGFRVLQNATLAAILASKTCYWEAHG